jgi:hypothetical protein
VKAKACIVVDGAAEYSVGVVAKNMNAEQMEAASDAISSGLTGASLERRLGEQLRQLAATSVTGAFAAQESEMCASDDANCGKADADTTTTAAPTTAAPSGGSATTAAASGGSATTANASGGSATTAAASGGSTAAPKPKTVKFTGTMTVKAPGVSKAQMQNATKRALEKQFEGSTVTVTVIESRRLTDSWRMAGSFDRRLAGSFAISYTVEAPAAQAAAHTAKMGELKKSTATLMTSLKTEMKAVGVDTAVLDKLEVSAFTSVTVVVVTPTTKAPAKDLEIDAASKANSALLQVASTMMFLALLGLAQ